MVLRSLFTLFILSAAIAACTDNRREERLARWEQTLRERERQFSLKEADYESLLRMRDSLMARKDTVVPESWPQAVNDRWNSTIICKESDCSDYVIGDQRSDVWEFTTDSAGMFAKVLNNSKLVRVFSGSFANNEIHLRFKTDSAVVTQVDRQVVLNQIEDNVMKGTEIITGKNNCTARFSVELARAPKK